ALSAECILERFGQRESRATYGDEFAFGNVTQGGRDPLARDVSASDQSPSKLFHIVFRCLQERMKRSILKAKVEAKKAKWAKKGKKDFLPFLPTLPFLLRFS